MTCRLRADLKGSRDWTRPTGKTRAFFTSAVPGNLITRAMPTVFIAVSRTKDGDDLTRVWVVENYLRKLPTPAHRKGVWTATYVKVVLKQGRRRRPLLCFISEYRFSFDIAGEGRSASI